MKEISHGIQFKVDTVVKLVSCIFFRVCLIFRIVAISRHKATIFNIYFTVHH
jgi:hypothetical protein